MTVTKREMVDGIVEASFPEDVPYGRKEKREMRKQKMLLDKSELEDAYNFVYGILEQREGKA